MDEFKENEDLPNTTNPDDWARISGKKGERIVFIRTLVTGKSGQRGRPVDRHGGQHRPVPVNGAAASSGRPQPLTASMAPVIGAVLGHGVCAGAVRHYSWLEPHERSAGHGHRDRVRHLRARPAGANAMVTSSQVVNAYRGGDCRQARRARWDFEEENPLRDARGFDLPARPRTPASSPTRTSGWRTSSSPTAPGSTSTTRTRSTPRPKCTNPRDAVLWDKAGERVMAEAAAQRAARFPAPQPIHLYKNNTDNKGASYGSHENYLMRRADAVLRTSSGTSRRSSSPARSSAAPAGSASARTAGSDGFQISQRADFFEVEVGLETTLKRPIINTRDEPHADPEKYRRLHVIIGDANLSEISTYLKLGTTALVLSMIEDRLPRRGPGARRAGRRHCARSRTTRPAAPGHAARRPDADRRPAPDGVPRAGPQVRRGPLRQATSTTRPRTCSTAGSQCSTGSRTTRCAWPESWTGSPSCELWRATGRDGLDWDHPRLQLVDLQYADVRPDKGLYNRLVAAGRMERLLDEQDVLKAVTNPPEDTRAYFRGRCLQQYAGLGRRGLLGLGDLRPPWP